MKDLITRTAALLLLVIFVSSLAACTDSRSAAGPGPARSTEIPGSSLSDSQKILNEINTYKEEVNLPSFINNAENQDSPLPVSLPEDDSLCIAVMGFALNKDGSMREELILRLSTALKCAGQYPEAYILVTGGGTASENKKATEADAMAQWLIDHHIDKSRIIIENKSLTTVENALYSWDILSKDYPQVKEVAVVTSDYHIPLSCLLFNAQFIIARNAASEASINVPAVSANAASHPDKGYVFTLADEERWLNVLLERNGISPVIPESSES